MKEDRAKKSGGSQGGHMGPRMGMPTEKAKDFKGTMKRLLGYLKPSKLKLLAVVLMAVLSTVFSIVSPKIMGKATTRLFEGLMAKFMAAKMGKPLPSVDYDYIGKILLILGAFYVISAFFSYIQQLIMAGVAQNTVFNMRRDIEDKLNKLPLKYFDSKTHGEILSRVTNDVDNIATTLQQSITQLITSLITLVGIIIMMLTISPVLTLICVVTLPLYIVVTKFVASKSQKHFGEQQKSLGELNGHVEEMYTGHKIIKAFGHEEKAINEFDEINEKLCESGWKAQFISGIIMPLMSFISNIGYVLICVVGGIFVIKKKIEIGDIQAFIQYSKQFTQPIVQTANIANILQSTVASAERVFELLDEVEEIADSNIIEFPKVNEDITENEIKKSNSDVGVSKESTSSYEYNIASQNVVKFEHVKFGYKEDVALIEDMNIDVKAGQTIAIVGPTGAGKTTLVNLLMRFYEINDGKITVDGMDIRDLTRGELRSKFGMVLQDTWLFNGTIKNNIAYGREGATGEDIIEAAKAAHADHFIRTLPEGYNTILNEEASNISQGQKQLLTIARAILANPAILILDEATSSVDTRTEVYIQKAMAALMKGRTSFVIAHRLSTIKDADLILVMNNGSVIEQGNHKELIEKGGFYAELYNSQFTGANLGA